MKMPYPLVPAVYSGNNSSDCLGRSPRAGPTQLLRRCESVQRDDPCIDGREVPLGDNEVRVLTQTNVRLHVGIFHYPSKKAGKEKGGEGYGDGKDEEQTPARLRRTQDRKRQRMK